MNSKKTLRTIKKNLEIFNRDPINGISLSPKEDNFYEWEIIIQAPEDTLYEDGIFKAKLTFPLNFPFKPPTFIFKTQIYHPNIYHNGKVCISILHEGKDEYGYESESERWRPVHTVNSIILSILSLLSSPNDESPANLDAAKDWRDHVNKVNNNFINKVNECVKKSIE
mgnify:CR=1 FL=1